MKGVTVKDILKRKLARSHQEKKRYLKALKSNFQLNHQIASGYTLGNLVYDKVKNRCIVTGRGRAVNQVFKISRLEFCRWAKLSKLPGVEKSSW